MMCFILIILIADATRVFGQLDCNIYSCIDLSFLANLCHPRKFLYNGNQISLKDLMLGVLNQRLHKSRRRGTDWASKLTPGQLRCELFVTLHLGLFLNFFQMHRKTCRVLSIFITIFQSLTSSRTLRPVYIYFTV